MWGDAGDIARESTTLARALPHALVAPPRQLEERAAQLRVLPEHGLQTDPGAAGDVEEMAEAAEVDRAGERRGAERGQRRDPPT